MGRADQAIIVFFHAKEFQKGPPPSLAIASAFSHCTWNSLAGVCVCACPCALTDLRSYKGLVEAYLEASNSKEAMTVAKEAMSKLPTNPGAVVLLGKVLAVRLAAHA